MTTSGRTTGGAQPRTGASRRDTALAGTVFVIAGVVLVVSAWLPWFRSAIDKRASSDVNGFRSGEWLLNLPIGWVVVVAGVALIAIGLASIAPKRVRWRAPTLLAAPIIGGVTLGWIIWDRFHLHSEVRSSLEAAVAKLVKEQPKQAAQAKAFLDSAHFTDRHGLWIAAFGALAATIAGVWLIRRDRQPTATDATAEA